MQINFLYVEAQPRPCLEIQAEAKGDPENYWLRGGLPNPQFPQANPGAVEDQCLSGHPVDPVTFSLHLWDLEVSWISFFIKIIIRLTS